MKEKTFKKFVDINNRRFDPSQPQLHQKHLTKNDEKEEPPKKKKKKAKNETPTPAQDNERFTKINYDELKDGFNSKKQEKKVESFSLEDMFNNDNEEEKNEETSGDSPKEGFSFNNTVDEGQNSSEEEEMEIDDEMPP